jgi:1,4-dihydroxy-2-naphthoyl-CoA hydrolase
MKPFCYPVRVRVYDTDAAGILYFANQFRFVQEGFEAFFEHLGHPIPEMVASSPYIAPTVHAETDYYRSLKAGDEIVVEVTVVAIGRTSMTLGYRMVGENNGVLYGRAEMVYVFIERDTRQKRPIPTAIRACLERYRSDA